MSRPQSQSKRFDLGAAARWEMIHEGFDPDFAPGTDQQIASIRSQDPPSPGNGCEDLRHLLWSSIDNDSSRDFDQIEYADRAGDGIRLLVAIADVDYDVPRDSPIDRHAAEETVTVYTAARVFPMLPEELSTDLTSLCENEDRRAVVIELVVAGDGSIGSSRIRRAVVRNRAQLTYNATGDWLQGNSGPPAKIAESPELQAQLRLQDEAAGRLREQRHRLGALDFERAEPVATITDGQVRDVHAAKRTRANDLIEDFMIAANAVMARTLTAAGVSSIRRVVKSPERWPRIVELAAQHGFDLPAEPDSGALNEFLQNRRKKDPDHYEDISLAVLKLMGPGEYVLSRPDDTGQGHFGLAAPDYTHSTAPNRRYADLVTQRLIKALLANQPTPYGDTFLAAIARNCTLKEDAARKVERTVGKRVAAVAMRRHIGEIFTAIVTGVTPRGTFVRVLNPPVEGMLCRGYEGVDVGDRIRVKLIGADPERGFIDFCR